MHRAEMLRPQQLTCPIACDLPGTFTKPLASGPIHAFAEHALPLDEEDDPPPLVGPPLFAPLVEVFATTLPEDLAGIICGFLRFFVWAKAPSAVSNV